MIEISELRKQIKQTIDRARHAAGDRRQRQDAATREGQRALEEIVTPIFKMTAGVLRAEGFPFQLSTPAGAVRLASERSRDEHLVQRGQTRIEKNRGGGDAADAAEPGRCPAGRRHETGQQPITAEHDALEHRAGEVSRGNPERACGIGCQNE